MTSGEEYRRHRRIREDAPIYWRIGSAGRTGEGFIRDISASGVLLEVDAFFSLDKGSIFIIEAAKGDADSFIPDQARLVWSKAMKMEKGKYLCGLEFIQPPDFIVDKITQRVEDSFSRLANVADVNILNNYFHGQNRR